MTHPDKDDDVPRIPRAYGGIQVNFCKNPSCANFGVEPLPKVSKGPQTATSITDNYRISGAGKLLNSLACKLCGDIPSLKSNQAIYEEFSRISAIHEETPICCPHESCQNHHVPVTTGKSAYSSFGSSTGDSKRYLCKACKKTFSVKTKVTIRQRTPEINSAILRMLMNKVAMRRICEIGKINRAILYNRIPFFQKCANALTAHYEKPLLDGRLQLNRLYLSSDRQGYLLNWTQREDRRNISLNAIGTADNASGYVFSMNLNFDPDCDADEIEAETIANNDYTKPTAHRRHARLWLRGDYKDAVTRSQKKLKKTSSDLSSDVELAYAAALERDDIDRSEKLTLNEQLPGQGMQVHDEYTLTGHFFYLKKLLKHVEKVRFFVDQDSPMRAGVINGFQDWVKDRKADIFFVRVSKDLTTNDKRALVKKSKDEIAQVQVDNPKLSISEVEIDLIKSKLNDLPSFGKWNDRWLIMPFPHMNEPQKAICHLTNFNDYDADHLAHLYRKASLHGIDRFFMLIRRRISLLERPISTSSSGRRTWNGYSSYNPAHVASILDIFRTYYNYCIIGDGAKETAAMKIGLCDHRVTDEEFLSFFRH